MNRQRAHDVVVSNATKAPSSKLASSSIPDQKGYFFFRGTEEGLIELNTHGEEHIRSRSDQHRTAQCMHSHGSPHFADRYNDDVD